MDFATFLTRWRGSAASERANYQLFLSELCDAIGVARPNPSSATSRDYVFERDVRLVRDDGTESIGRIDLYKRGCFVLEAKQGADAEPERLAELTEREAKLAKKKRGHGTRGSAAWDDAMYNARRQAERYARALPVEEGWPPFLIVVDVGHSIELYADFARSGKLYVPFPDPRTHRIRLDALGDESQRKLLRAVFEDPMSLDPARVSAAVTRAVAEPIAALARELEAAGNEPAAAAEFLMRCLFTMFAEDVGLLPAESFTGLLSKSLQVPEGFVLLLESLWATMDQGGFNTAIACNVLKFNGYLFKKPAALKLQRRQIEMLLQAARSDWRSVEPAIFGTLLERALDPRERHKLGAHYTPRAYVERLVFPTVIDPLRDEWAAVRARAVELAVAGADTEAETVVKDFHTRLCGTRVLDPACGTGNFLYVTMEHMKRLEGEVLQLLGELTGAAQELLELSDQTVDPHNFLGIELNPRAAAIAELVLWIGYLQWHYRTRSSHPSEPILRAFGNIENRDAILAWDTIVPRLDVAGNVVTRWDGVSTKTHPVTGEQVPDESAQVPVWDYTNPRKAEWPEAEYVVGNPPFLGKLRIVSELGEGYAEALRKTYDGDVPDSADFVMYWWFRAAQDVARGSRRSLGLITTNSITQTFNRRLITSAIESGASITFAIPDHPWVDTASGAAVRIAMTVLRRGDGTGRLCRVIAESPGPDGAHVVLREQDGLILPDLTVGPDVRAAGELQSNADLSSNGMMFGSRAFVLTEAEHPQWDSRYLFDTVGGRDILQTPRNAKVFDFFGMTEAEVREADPRAYQYVYDRMVPRTSNEIRVDPPRFWWRYGKERPALREMLRGVTHYLAVPEVAKHFIFTRHPKTTVPEHPLVAIALSDAYHLGVLSSRVHVCWALAAGGTLEDRPRYNKTLCFDPFPFPVATPAQEARIRELGEQLDAHRKRQQAAHPGLTLTGMYNVLEALREGRELSKKERTIHEQGLVSVLRQIHDDLDRAVLDAYGWPHDLDDEGILERLVALNAERAAEEAQGHIRWLRPDYQRPLWEARQKGGRRKGAATDEAGDDEGGDDEADEAGEAESAATLRPWPARMKDQIAAVREALATLGKDATAEAVAAMFEGVDVAVVGEVMEVVGG